MNRHDQQSMINIRERTNKEIETYYKMMVEPQYRPHFKSTAMKYYPELLKEIIKMRDKKFDNVQEFSLHHKFLLNNSKELTRLVLYYLKLNFLIKKNPN